MKIIVTGGAGFIGSHVADAYIAAGHRVAVIDDLSAGSRKNMNPPRNFIRPISMMMAPLKRYFRKNVRRS